MSWSCLIAIAFGIALTLSAQAIIDDVRNARAFAPAKPPRHPSPIATVIVRADRDAAADITRALARPSSRWN